GAGLGDGGGCPARPVRPGGRPDRRQAGGLAGRRRRTSAAKTAEAGAGLICRPRPRRQCREGDFVCCPELWSDVVTSLAPIVEVRDGGRLRPPRPPVRPPCPLRVPCRRRAAG